MIDWLLERAQEYLAEGAVGVPGAMCTYRELVGAIEARVAELARMGVEAGTVASLEGDYGPDAIAWFLALAARGAIVVPISSDARPLRDVLLETAEVELRVSAATGELRRTDRQASHALYTTLRERRHPGLVLFTSGSTGIHKGAVHDLTALLEKFKVARGRYRTLVFLQIDHIGGINTLFYTLSNGGMSVVPGNRSPEAVCRSIEEHRVELLPTSPTFLNLLLLSGAYTRYDLSSLRLVTYGTEPMPASTLTRLADALPHAQLLQTYGSTELGILRSKSRERDSLWVRVGGEGYETKVVDGRLWVRSACAMLGYLNAPSPFDADGFLDTGDLVEADGEWLRILGRRSEVINVGGSKVHPAEVESVLLTLDNVADACVRGEPHPITGQIVAATVHLTTPERPVDFRARLRQFCMERLAPYKVPARVTLSDQPLHSERYKRVRRAAPLEEGAS
jgi:acyl-coenzyme A synthetase/AMP-(fatty) acid ligase